jgi:predicted transcriptional regulator
MPKQRTGLEIAAEILDIANAKRGLRTTHIQYAANLSWNMTKRYLETMVSDGLLIIEDDRYKTTKKGKSWLGYYNRLIERTPEEFI